MRTNNILAHYTTLALLLSVGCLSENKPVQAQVSEHVRLPLSPQSRASASYAGQLNQDAAAALHSGRYADAESDAQESIQASPIFCGVPKEILAESLDAQGRSQEALQVYKTIIKRFDRQPRNLLPYAQLLLKSGQWTEALAVYNQALPHLPDIGSHPETPVVHDGDLMRANSHFSADVPEPAALATALHIARGMVYNVTPSWVGEAQDTEAMAEYGKALQLAPNNALTNYYYGAGWQKLSPTERTKFGTVQQAKAALQKAEKTGNAGVKAAAQKALKELG